MRGIEESQENLVSFACGNPNDSDDIFQTESLFQGKVIGIEEESHQIILLYRLVDKYNCYCY